MEQHSDTVKIVTMFSIDRQDGKPDDIMLVCQDNKSRGYYNFVARSKTPVWYKLKQSKGDYINRQLNATYIFDKTQYKNTAVLTELNKPEEKPTQPYYFIFSNGYTIFSELYPSKEKAFEKMQTEFDSCWAQYPNKKDNSMADECYISEETGSAVFYNDGYDVFVYKILPAPFKKEGTE